MVYKKNVEGVLDGKEKKQRGIDRSRIYTIIDEKAGNQKGTIFGRVISRDGLENLVLYSSNGKNRWQKSTWTTKNEDIRRPDKMAGSEKKFRNHQSS